MAYVELRIREAAEKGLYDFDKWKLVRDAHRKAQADAAIAMVLTDPSFWEALGKARGWNERSRTCPVCGCGEGRRDMHTQPNWQHYWHRFIDYLAGGGSVDDFFENII